MHEQLIIIHDLCRILSIYIEAFAILPQVIMLHRHEETESLSMVYVVFLGMYRCKLYFYTGKKSLYVHISVGTNIDWFYGMAGLFVLNWIYRSYFDPYYDSTGWIEWIFGAIQSFLYILFFTVYTKIKYRDSLQKLY